MFKRSTLGLTSYDNEKLMVSICICQAPLLEDRSILSEKMEINTLIYLLLTFYCICSIGSLMSIFHVLLDEVE